jgi:hypothetical protein
MGNRFRQRGPLADTSTQQAVIAPRRRRTPDRSGDLKALLDEGLTYAEIGERYGLTRQRIHQLAAEAGIHGSRSRAATPARNRRFIALLHEGMSLTDAGRAVRVSPTYASELACRLGFSVKARDHAEQIRQLMPLIERVRAGESYNHVAGGQHALAERLRQYCRELGIESAHLSHNPRAHGGDPAYRAAANEQLGDRTRRLWADPEWRARELARRQAARLAARQRHEQNLE